MSFLGLFGGDKKTTTLNTTQNTDLTSGATASNAISATAGQGNVYITKTDSGAVQAALNANVDNVGNVLSTVKQITQDANSNVAQSQSDALYYNNKAAQAALDYGQSALDFAGKTQSGLAQAYSDALGTIKSTAQMVSDQQQTTLSDVIAANQAAQSNVLKAANYAVQQATTTPADQNTKYMIMAMAAVFIVAALRGGKVL